MRRLVLSLLLAAVACAGGDPAGGAAEAGGAADAPPAAAASPDRWRVVTAAAGDSSFVDTETVTDTAGVRTVWILRRVQPGSGAGDSSMTRYGFRCGAREWRTWEETAVIAGSIRPEGWSAWRPIEAATWGERAMRVACDSVAVPAELRR